VTTDTGAPPPLPRSTANSQWEGSLRPLALLIVVCLALVIAAWRYGVPALASAAAVWMPVPVVETIGDLTLAGLDAHTFEPSAISAARQADLVNRFSRLRFPDGTTSAAYEIVFRRSDAVGANAMALPSGTIIVTDGLVDLSGDDDEIVAVLAHEAGHVQERHGLRQMFQGSFTRAGVSWLLGDVSALAAGLSTVLLEAKYSRDFERDADAYAVRVLDASDISRDHFARMLERLEQSMAGGGAADGGPGLRYLSSHPVTRERLETVRSVQ
jgi:Zn-dependent protease with chaperone function